MTVASETSKSGPYAGAGTTGPFTVGFRFLDETHLRVIKTSTTGIDSDLTLTTDYTVAGVGNETGSVTLVTALASGEKLTIIRDVPFVQQTDYLNNDAFPAESHENALDLLTMQTQQLKERVDAALTLPATTSGVSTQLPTPEANKIIGWNSAASGLQNHDTQTLATIVAFGTANADLFDGDGSTTQFTLSDNPGALNNLDVSIGGVTQTPGLDYTWTSGTTITFTSAPPVGTDNVLVRYMQALPQGAGDAGATEYLPAGTGAIATNVQTQLRRAVYAANYGVVADSNGTTGNGTDNTVPMALALYAAKVEKVAYTLVMPRGICRFAQEILVDAPVRLVGEGCAPYVGTIGTLGDGTWLYFDHTGKGINIDGPSIMSGVSLEKFGTLRNQPTPAPGWTPTAHDFDIYIDNADVYIDNLMTLNPTKAIYLGNGQAGRLTIGTLRGQPMQVGLEVDVALDVVSAERIHFWPFWRDDTNVHTYTMANLDAVYLKRCDNPMFTNVFSIFARATVRCGQGATGTVSKLKVSNLDCDRGKLGLWVDNTVTSGIIAYIGAMTHQGETGLAGSKAVHVQGNSSTIEFGSLRTDRCDQNGVHVEGTGNVTRIGTLTIANYNQAAAGHAAVLPANGNDIHIAYLPTIINGGAGAKYGSTGNVFVDEWRSYTPTVTSGTGTITTLGAVVGRFRLYQQTLSYLLDIPITTNGTAGGDIRATLPAAASSVLGSIGNGREQGVSGKQLQALVGASSSQAVIYNYDGTYPGGDGTRLFVGGTVPLP